QQAGRGWHEGCPSCGATPKADHTNMKRRAALCIGVLLASAVTNAAAQNPALRPVNRWGAPELGLNLALGLGRGEFKTFGRAAGGIGGYPAVPLGPAGTFPLRRGFRGPHHNYDARG